MKTRFMMCLMLLILMGTSIFSQTKGVKLKQVKIGDKVPNYSLTHLLNYPQKSVKLNAFKGKILILDFWTFGCSSCVASWPKLMKLQQKFKDKIQIITVNIYQKEESIKAFLAKREKMVKYKMTLPIACGDKQLKLLFPHLYVPHVVFIDQTGMVKYITEGGYLNEETIQKLIDGKEMDISEKTDDYADPDLTKPLFINGNMVKGDTGGNLIWSSMINPYSPSLAAVNLLGRYKGVSIGYIPNSSVKSIFRILYGKGVSYEQNPRWLPISQITFEQEDTTGLVDKVNDSERPQNRYTIQVTSKREIAVEQIRRKMISDVEQCFGLKTTWEKKVKRCLVLSRTKLPLTQWTNGERDIRFGSTMLDINNITIQDFIDNLLITELGNTQFPIIDETKFDGKLGHIKFDTGSENIDFKVLGRELQKFGLEFSIQDRETDILVVRVVK